MEGGPVELSIKDVYMANDDQSNQQVQPAQFSCIFHTMKALVSSSQNEMYFLARTLIP
jgi:hypothetical protein